MGLTCDNSSGDESFLPFPPYLAIDPTTPTNLYFTGKTQLYQSRDGANTWTAFAPNVTFGNGDLCQIGVAPNDSNVVYTGSCDGAVSVFTNAANGAAKFTSITNGLPEKAVTHISVDPASAGTAYVTMSGNYSGHIFVTHDMGQSWTDLTNNLPDITVSDLVIDSMIPNTLYAATDMGVYWSNNLGQSWAILGVGLPNSPIVSLTMHENSRTLVAATHGRGVWAIAMPSTANLIPVIVQASPNQSAIQTGVVLTVSGANFTPASRIYWNDSALTTVYVSATSLTAAIPASLTASGSLAEVVVYTPGPGGGQSNIAYVKMGDGPAFVAIGLANAASMAYGYGLAPGSVATVYGVDLASLSAAGCADGCPNGLPQMIAGSSVTIRDLNLQTHYSAPLFYAGPGQINFQVPWELQQRDTVLIEPVLNGTVGAAISMPVRSFAPGIFTLSEGGSGPGAIVDANSGQVVGPNTPAHPGDFISIYCTGLGAVDNTPPDGSPPTSLTHTKTRVGSLSRRGCASLECGAVFRPRARLRRTLPDQRSIAIGLQDGRRCPVAAIGRGRHLLEYRLRSDSLVGRDSAEKSDCRRSRNKGFLQHAYESGEICSTAPLHHGRIGVDKIEDAHSLQFHPIPFRSTLRA